MVLDVLVFGAAISLADTSVWQVARVGTLEFLLIGKDSAQSGVTNVKLGTYLTLGLLARCYELDE